MRDMALHTARRKPWSRGMNSAAIKYYEVLIRNTIVDLVNGLKQREGKTVDISEWMTYFGFGYPCDSLIFSIDEPFSCPIALTSWAKWRKSYVVTLSVVLRSFRFTHDYGFLKTGSDAGGLYELIENAMT